MDVTFEVVWGSIVLVGMVITAITSVLTLREKWSSARKPHYDHMAQVDEHERKLNADYNRLSNLESKIENLSGKIDTIDADYKEFRTLNRIQTAAIRALLKHSINGNDIHKLETELEFIDRYLHPEILDEGGEHVPTSQSRHDKQIA